jgi:hypothetical protein
MEYSLRYGERGFDCDPMIPEVNWTGSPVFGVVGGRRKTFGSVMLRLPGALGETQIAPSTFAKSGRGVDVALFFGPTNDPLRNTRISKGAVVSVGDFGYVSSSDD